MTGAWCSLNGRLIPAGEAAIGVDDIDFTYGYGVYETLKIRKKILYFPGLHAERLLHSASVIGLAHNFTSGAIEEWIRELARANAVADANIKIVFIGGKDASRARLYIMSLAPLFPDRRLYRDGATATLYRGERVFPAAKTLNMLVSTLAFREAQAAGAYDALLCTRGGLVTEGTRTNLFFTDNSAVYTPPADTVLEGVTKLTLSRALAEENIPLAEMPLPEAELSRWEGYFLTSTSTKVVPLCRVAQRDFGIPPLTRRIMEIYDGWLRRYAATQEAVF
ncbi:MAG: aminotransferase class IV [Spirochaetaceae bacterium]|nr:aminotransferase class IV [Spirochaetaceae bacterium]